MIEIFQQDKVLLQSVSDIEYQAIAASCLYILTTMVAPCSSSPQNLLENREKVMNQFQELTQR